MDSLCPFCEWQVQQQTPTTHHEAHQEEEAEHASNAITGNIHPLQGASQALHLSTVFFVQCCRQVNRHPDCNQSVG
jgi:hypothetical protein